MPSPARSLISGAVYTLHPLAYLKALLHAAKHPHASVLGLLIGSSDGKEVDIEDGVPLVHHWAELSPMIEAGLCLANTHAKSRGLQLVGIYCASSRLSQTGLTATAQKVAEAVRKVGCAEAVALVMQGDRLASPSEPLFLPYTPSGTSWSPHPTAFTSTSSNFLLSDPVIPSKALASVHGHGYRTLCDFDDHLEDIGCDWLANPTISLKPEAMKTTSFRLFGDSLVT